LEDSDSEEHIDDGIWIMGSGSRQVPAFTDSNVGLECNAAPNIKDDSSFLEYFKLFFTEYVITLEEFVLPS
jgi:hypothetical protein